MEVLYEDNHLLVVNKPGELPTMGAVAGKPSLLDHAKDYIRRRYNKPGNVYLGVVSRLDAMVSGVLVLARTSKAAARLTDQFRRGLVEKRYLALVEQPPDARASEIEDWLRKDESQRKVVTCREGSPGAKLARLRYRTLETRVAGAALLEIELLTGRKHQIRVQLASRGSPIVGDRKYGARRAFPNGIALHASRLRISHPVQREPMSWECAPPSSWPAAALQALEQRSS